MSSSKSSQDQCASNSSRRNCGFPLGMWVVRYVEIENSHPRRPQVAAYKRTIKQNCPSLCSDYLPVVLKYPAAFAGGVVEKLDASRERHDGTRWELVRGGNINQVRRAFRHGGYDESLLIGWYTNQANT